MSLLLLFRPRRDAGGVPSSSSGSLHSKKRREAEVSALGAKVPDSPVSVPEVEALPVSDSLVTKIARASIPLNSLPSPGVQLVTEKIVVLPEPLFSEEEMLLVILL